MVPEHWIPHRRQDDGELLGYLVPVEEGVFAPVTVFGHPLGEAGDREDVERTLDAVGLSYLADRWMLQLPERDEPIAVQLVEASPERLVVQNVDFGYEGDYGTRFHLDVPETGRLRRA
ncbi:hypothetical protein [Micromonospora globbae]|uniref:Uncharacterized protein n=1 Tax=Micromonospora globbae TaxID=1894969 RepID=A0A420ETH9_9ACTN|nr:hypothetical protein [Micromonospora globbae]RKF23943.1 hypothetical protein D7I43_28970 [Micromonospora globbae]WTF85142.1 hypothetical protein OH732_26190 [Micromonospora globbae]